MKAVVALNLVLLALAAHDPKEVSMKRYAVVLSALCFLSTADNFAQEP
jgi:hypothetical protein